MRTQLAYIQQLENKTTEALTIYNKVLKSRPTDIALTAVISNNIFAVHKVSLVLYTDIMSLIWLSSLHNLFTIIWLSSLYNSFVTSSHECPCLQEKDLFDSKKRLKSMSVNGLENKLTKNQQEVLENNKCLIYMYTNQVSFWIWMTFSNFSLQISAKRTFCWTFYCFPLDSWKKSEVSRKYILSGSVTCRYFILSFWIGLPCIFRGKDEIVFTFSVDLVTSVCKEYS